MQCPSPRFLANHKKVDTFCAKCRSLSSSMSSVQCCGHQNEVSCKKRMLLEMTSPKLRSAKIERNPKSVKPCKNPKLFVTDMMGVLSLLWWPTLLGGYPAASCLVVLHHIQLSIVSSSLHTCSRLPYLIISCIGFMHGGIGAIQKKGQNEFSVYGLQHSFPQCTPPFPENASCFLFPLF